MMEAKVHQGGCHCGRVRYSVKSDLAKVVSCNCSMCQKAGWLLAFVPAGDFHLESGAGDLSDYQFNKKHIHHLFCKACGVKSFARGTAPDGREMIAVNVRCLDGADLTRITPVAFDGRSL
jgi:hypothetical protein